jgi:chromosomal replication initiator protein
MSILSSFWNDFLDKLQASDIKNIPVLYSLLKQLKPLSLVENKLTLGCNNSGMRFFLEKKKPEIEAILLRLTQQKIVVDLTVCEKKTHQTEIKTPLLNFTPSQEDIFYKAGLNKKYSFNNFAVSPSNQVAYAAAQAVVENLGNAYNPLLFYGGVGVGKTHLAQSLAKKILEKDPTKKVFFSPGDLFTNELIEAIREKSTIRFRKKYRQLNLLIIDDVQFIAGKQTVQEEFFHTFNSILSRGGQVVLTSDRPPEEIKNLEDRLKSRFSGGLNVDIQPPDFELRTAILLIKAREKNIDIDIEAAKIIAEQIIDTRALEGTLLSIYAKTIGITNKISLDVVDGFFNEKKNNSIKKISHLDIIKTVCAYYNIKQSQIKSSSRSSEIALARQIIMYLLRTELKIKLQEIAYILKRKDHTTIIHAIDKIMRLISKDPTIKEDIDKITKTINLSP